MDIKDIEKLMDTEINAIKKKLELKQKGEAEKLQNRINVLTFERGYFPRDKKVFDLDSFFKTIIQVGILFQDYKDSLGEDDEVKHFKEKKGILRNLEEEFTKEKKNLKSYIEKFLSDEINKEIEGSSQTKNHSELIWDFDKKLEKMDSYFKEFFSNKEVVKAPNFLFEKLIQFTKEELKNQTKDLESEKNKLEKALNVFSVKFIESQDGEKSK